MFGATGFASARTRYAHVDLGSKVEGASPHRLIGILYEELTKTCDTIAAGLAAGGVAGGAGLIARRARANSILLGLEASLDHDAGGTVSASLVSVYRQARGLINEGVIRRDPALIAQAREMIAEIADAWAAIG